MSEPEGWQRRGDAPFAGVSTAALRALLWGLIAALVIGSALALPHLPERMPIHFGFSGVADSWIDRSATMWFLPPALYIGIVALVLAVIRSPEAWKLTPERVRRYRALAPAEQETIRQAILRSTYVGLAFGAIAIMAVQASVFLTALTRAERMPAIPAAVMVLSLIGLLLLGSRGQRWARARLDARSPD